METSVEVMALWNTPQPLKDFFGVILGYFESHNIKTNELAILTAMIDCTHKRFVFFLHTNDKAKEEKNKFDKVFQQAKTINQHPIIWCWVKKKLLRRIDLYYDLRLNNLLCQDIDNLWALCNEWSQTYKEKSFPKQLPHNWHTKLDRLERQCKSTIKNELKP